MKKGATKRTPVKKVILNPTKGNSTHMDTSEIRNLIDFIANTGLNEVNLETKDLKLHVKRDPDQTFVKPAENYSPAISPSTRPSSTPPKEEKVSAPITAGKNTLEIKSPMIGTFYRSANPDTPPFVSVGDKIIKGQIVCIIEAMKLFNEIEAEISGTVVKVLLENATPVEYDQVLFVVEPE